MKYSRQREAVKAVLMRHKDHPTADMVYSELKATEPNISLATVYRNLNLLSELGEIKKLSFQSGADYYDPTTVPHDHFICERCGKIQDVQLDMNRLIMQSAERAVKGAVLNHELVLYGICDECQAHSQKNGNS